MNGAHDILGITVNMIPETMNALENTKVEKTAQIKIQ